MIQLFADNIRPDHAAGVFAHEGWHRLLRALRVEESPLYGKLMDRLAKLEQAPALAAWVKQARAMSSDEEMADDAHRLNELAAYAITHYENSPKSLPWLILRWVQDMVSAVRTFFMERLGWVPQDLTDADLAAQRKPRRRPGRSQAKASPPPDRPELQAALTTLQYKQQKPTWH